MDNELSQVVVHKTFIVVTVKCITMCCCTRFLVHAIDAGIITIAIKYNLLYKTVMMLRSSTNYLHLNKILNKTCTVGYGPSLVHLEY